jgi:hypothetical protein
MKIDTKLAVEIDDELNAMAHMEKGSEKYKVTADGVVKLLDKAIEIERLENEREEKEAARKERRREHTIDTVVKAVGFGTTTILTIWGTIVCLNYERTGTITTVFGKGFIRGLLPSNWK